MKPKEILELEEFYGIELNQVGNLDYIIKNKNRNTFYIDGNNQLVGLNIFDNKISDLYPIKDLRNLQLLDLSDNKISNLYPIKT
ncbi:MAG: hypothetical protein IPL95_09720 [Saprospiraceae bacterium]|nr:hypothetical protein [Saprospiraceae bacterium]